MTGRRRGIGLRCSIDQRSSEVDELMKAGAEKRKITQWNVNIFVDMYKATSGDAIYMFDLP